MKSLFLVFLICLIVIILFLGLVLSKKKENFEDDIFYTSKLRLTDYQDIISSSESQLIKNNYYRKEKSDI